MKTGNFAEYGVKGGTCAGTCSSKVGSQINIKFKTINSLHIKSKLCLVDGNIYIFIYIYIYKLY